MNMFDLFTEDAFTEAEEAGLIKARPDGEGLLIWNYTDRAMFTPGAWDNRAVRVCRGLIVDADTGTVVARPWSKFFNYGQAEAGDLDLDAPVEVTDKMDGSLGVVYAALDGTQKVASRGSFQSDQAVHATRRLHEMGGGDQRWLCDLESVTPLVEIIYPENRIVCDYGWKDDLVLLGGVEISTGRYLSPEDTAEIIGWDGELTTRFRYKTLREALEAPPRPGAEGMCVRFLDENRIVKIKQEDYVALHKIVTGLSEKTVWEHMLTEKPLEDLLAPLPDELHEWTRSVWDELDFARVETTIDAHSIYAEIMESLPEDHGRGEFAAQAKSYGKLTPYLFALLDGRNIKPMILKTMKPVGATRAKAVSEDVA